MAVGAEGIVSRWKRENDFDPIIRPIADKYGVEPAFLKAVIAQESRFSPSAARSEPQLHDASAGLMQILYSTAKGQGYRGTFGSPTDLTGLFDPAINVEYGARYLRDCLARTSAHANAASMYNGGYRPNLGFGERATRQVTICLARDSNGKCIKSRTVPPGEFANQEYVNNVLANYAYFKSQEPGAPASPPSSAPASGAGPTPGPAVYFRPNRLGAYLLGLLALWVALRRRLA